MDFLARVDDLVNEWALEWLERALSLMRAGLLDLWLRQNRQVRVFLRVHVALVDHVQLMFLRTVTSRLSLLTLRDLSLLNRRHSLATRLALIASELHG